MKINVSKLYVNLNRSELRIQEKFSVASVLCFSIKI